MYKLGMSVSSRFLQNSDAYAFDPGLDDLNKGHSDRHILESIRTQEQSSIPEKAQTKVPCIMNCQFFCCYHFQD